MNSMCEVSSCASSPIESTMWINEIESAKSTENAVRRVKQDTSALLVPSRLFRYVVESMECFCYLRNIKDKVAARMSLNERRCGTSFDGPILH